MRSIAISVVAVLFVGSLLGLLLDQIHVRGGALSYANPWLAGQAWWVGPQFGIAFALLAAAALHLQLRLDRRGMARPGFGPGALLVAVAWFVAAYITSAVAWDQPWLVTVLLAGAMVLRAAAEPIDRVTWAVAVVIAVAGTGWEAWLSSLDGTFAYAETAGLPAPPWLPLLYVHGAPLVRAFMVLVMPRPRQRTDQA
jgi:hypothetical protein